MGGEGDNQDISGQGQNSHAQGEGPGFFELLEPEATPRAQEDEGQDHQAHIGGDVREGALRRREGIDIDNRTWSQVVALAGELGVEVKEAG